VDAADPGSRRWWRLLARPLPAAIAVIATVGVFVVPSLVTGAAGPLDLAVVGLGVLTLVAVYARARQRAAAAAGEPMHSFAWPPALAFGAVVTALGVAFAPVPHAAL